MIGIYMFKNLINGKIYVGQSINISYRHYRHESNARNTKLLMPLYNDMRLYGIENFEFSVLEECQFEKLNELEEMYIKKFGSLYPKGYNVHKGGSTTQRTTDKLDGKVAEAIDMIENTSMDFSDIANHFGVHKSLISKINLGNRYHDKLRVYPLRKIKDRLESQELILIIDLLKKDELTIKQISSMLDTSQQAISNINTGRTYYNKNLIYPIKASSKGRIKSNGKKKRI